MENDARTRKRFVLQQMQQNNGWLSEEMWMRRKMGIKRFSTQVGTLCESRRPRLGIREQGFLVYGS